MTEILTLIARIIGVSIPSELSQGLWHFNILDNGQTAIAVVLLSVMVVAASLISCYFLDNVGAPLPCFPLIFMFAAGFLLAFNSIGSVAIANYSSLPEISKLILGCPSDGFIQSNTRVVCSGGKSGVTQDVAGLRDAFGRMTKVMQDNQCIVMRDDDMTMQCFAGGKGSNIGVSFYSVLAKEAGFTGPCQADNKKRVTENKTFQNTEWLVGGKYHEQGTRLIRWAPVINFRCEPQAGYSPLYKNDIVKAFLNKYAVASH